jgi:hypothetical protein
MAEDMPSTPMEIIAEYVMGIDATFPYAEGIITELDKRGFVIAPKVPTDAMLKAADSIMGGGFQNSRSDREIYEAMIEIAARDSKRGSE